MRELCCPAPARRISGSSLRLFYIIGDRTIGSHIVCSSFCVIRRFDCHSAFIPCVRIRLHFVFRIRCYRIPVFCEAVLSNLQCLISTFICCFGIYEIDIVFPVEYCFCTISIYDCLVILEFQIPFSCFIDTIAILCIGRQVIDTTGCTCCAGRRL